MGDGAVVLFSIISQRNSIFHSKTVVYKNVYIKNLYKIKVPLDNKLWKTLDKKCEKTTGL